MRNMQKTHTDIERYYIEQGRSCTKRLEFAKALYIAEKTVENTDPNAAEQRLRQAEQIFVSQLAHNEWLYSTAQQHLTAQKDIYMQQRKTAKQSCTAMLTIYMREMQRVEIQLIELKNVNEIQCNELQLSEGLRPITQKTRPQRSKSKATRPQRSKPKPTAKKVRDQKGRACKARHQSRRDRRCKYGYD